MQMNRDNRINETVLRKTNFSLFCCLRVLLNHENHMQMNRDNRINETVLRKTIFSLFCCLR
ncbi:Argininosuccinate lyase [Frankliniella fusca]|uniref:Argininosuccinate lyase n=1 Tax=Frankliniella fusca TaxID=407009 RepID=A0AAE1LLB4_9NEOP|nr:Argininosuccinate lyase [Frankliniella fusca]